MLGEDSDEEFNKHVFSQKAEVQAAGHFEASRLRCSVELFSRALHRLLACLKERLIFLKIIRLYTCDFRLLPAQNCDLRA